MPRIEAIAFDMDGLMVDTETIGREAWRIVVEGMGCSFEDDVYLRIVGRRSDESAEIMRSYYKLSVPSEELLREKNAAFFRILDKTVPVMAGLRTLHKEIVKRNIPWAVATSSPCDYAADMLSRIQLQDGCHAIVGGDEVERGKPSPDIYLLAAERLGLAPSKCLALEDSAPGCRAAIAAGMEVVAVPGNHTREEEFGFVRHVFNSLLQVAENLDVLINP